MKKALETASPAERAQHLVLEAAFKQAQARAAGVDLARANFITKLTTFATVAVSASVAATLTVATLGAAAPLMALTGLRLVQAIADVGCAAVCWRDAKASVKAGRTIQTLPMGANAMGNLLHKGYRWFSGCGMGDPDAKHFATVGAAVFTVGLSVATVMTGQLFTPAARPTAQACRWAATAVATLMLRHEYRTATQTTDAQNERLKEAAVGFKAAKELARELKQGERNKLVDVIGEIVETGRRDGAHPLLPKGELEAFCDTHKAGWPATPAPDPAEVERLKDMEDSNQKARDVARWWIFCVTLMNFGMALNGGATVIKSDM